MTIASVTPDESDIYQKLTKKFPNDAISTDSSRGFDLTSIKAQYVVERLNEVFGIAGWSLHGEFKPADRGILFIGELTLKTLNHSVQAIGFSLIKKVLGDSYKSARTDALSKAASWIGVGNEIFKGHGNIEAADTEDEKEAKKFKLEVCLEAIKQGGLDRDNADDMELMHKIYDAAVKTNASNIPEFVFQYLNS